MKAKVSIIIPAFNEEKFLPLCLDSISRLNWPKDRLEMIVIDNGSMDNTCRIAESYGAKLLIDKEKKVAGLRNLGARYATGDILAFIDADCVLGENCIANSKKYFIDPEIAVWGGPPVPPVTASWVQKTWFLMPANAYEYEEREWIGTIDLFVHKNIFEKIGGFNEDLLTCEDVDFCYRVSQYGKIISDKNIIVTHLREADSVKEFFKKEIWRGRGNIKGAFKHGIKLKEIPSLAIPFYFAFFLPVLVLITLWTSNFFMGFLVLLAAVFPGLLILFKVRHKKAGVILKIQLFFLSYIYFIARSMAVFQFKNDQ